MFNAGINRFGSSAPVVSNLIWINALMFLATLVVESTFRINLRESLGLYYPESDNFKLYQVITHMFIHQDFFHIFFNMLMLWMFGRALENAWGSKRFLIFYLITGVGAALCHNVSTYFETMPIRNFVHEFAISPTPDMMKEFANHLVRSTSSRSELLNFISEFGSQFNDPAIAKRAVNLVYTKYYSETLSFYSFGASGAVYGVLLGFGMLFPNTILMLIFPPIPIKAKYMVMFMGGVQLYLSFSQPGSDIAHIAHLGGMLFGYFIIRYWNSKRTNFY